MGHDLDDWKTKAEAAEILSCSQKTIERMAAQKRIQKIMRRNPGRKATPVYHPGDIEAIRSDSVQFEGFHVGRDEEQVMAMALPPPQSGDDRPAPLSADRDSPVPATTAPRHKLFLTLDEAADYSGMPKAWLLRKIEKGELSAIEAGGWRIRRADLEQL